jgi:hypothetical protein
MTEIIHPEPHLDESNYCICPCLNCLDDNGCICKECSCKDVEW